jgi:hypothetical protein
MFVCIYKIEVDFYHCCVAIFDKMYIDEVHGFYSSKYE